MSSSIISDTNIETGFDMSFAIENKKDTPLTAEVVINLTTAKNIVSTVIFDVVLL